MAAITGSMANRQQVQQQSADPAGDMAAVAAMVPFTRGALKCIEIGTAQASTLGTSAVIQQHVLPMVNGWDRRWLLDVVVASSGNSATVALGPDAPWALFSQVNKNDNRQQLLYQLRGYDAFLAHSLGGYAVFPLTGDSDSYTALTTGGGATAGSGRFILPIPDEFGREGWGAWPNMDSSQRRTINISLAPLATAGLFATPPNGTVTATVTPICVYYARPPAIDAESQPVADRPDMAGSISYWREEVPIVSAGDNVITLRMTGRKIRTAYALFTTAADVRSNSVRPTNMRCELDSAKIFDTSFASVASDLYVRTGIVLPTGLWPLNIGTLMPDGIQGQEYPDGYWTTSNGSQLVLKFTTSTAGKLYFIVNEVVFAGPLPSNL
jgi:hypothetical protein